MSVSIQEQRGREEVFTMSSRYFRPWARVLYGNGRRRYEVRTDDGGWFQYFDIVKYQKADRFGITGVWVSSSIPETLQPYTYRQNGAKFTEDCTYLDMPELRGMFLKPWLTDMDYNMVGQRGVDYPSGDLPSQSVPACRYHFDFNVKYWAGRPALAECPGLSLPFRFQCEILGGHYPRRPRASPHWLLGDDPRGAENP